MSVDYFLLFCMQAFGTDDSDVGSPRDNSASIGSSNLHTGSQPRDSNIQLVEQQGQLKKEIDNSASEVESSTVAPSGEQFQSVGEILSSIRPGQSHTLQVSGFEGGSGRSMGKMSNSNLNTKRSTLWGRNAVSNLAASQLYLQLMRNMVKFID